MITGDNPLTGSNIGFKCGISDKSKGMIICDYKEGKFNEEKFIYHEREEEELNVTTEALKNEEPGIVPLENTFAEIVIHKKQEDIEMGAP